MKEYKKYVFKNSILVAVAVEILAYLINPSTLFGIITGVLTLFMMLIFFTLFNILDLLVKRCKK